MTNPFKIGDVVLCTYNFQGNNNEPQKGEIFTVTSIEKNYIGFELRRLTNRYSVDTANGKNANWGCGCFELDEKYLHDINFNNKLEDLINE